VWVINTEHLAAVFAMQGLFAIIEFEDEESAQKALSYDEDISLSGRRLVVRPRRVKRQQQAAPSDESDRNNGEGAEISAADLHSRLINKLASCDKVCI